MITQSDRSAGGCRFMLAVPENVELELLARVLRGPADVACVVVTPSEAMEKRGRADTLPAIRDLVQNEGAALLVRDSIDLAPQFGLDGVEVEAATYASARRRLGDGLIIGVRCEISRHAAMEAGEAKAEYVAFTKVANDLDQFCELLADWQQSMLVPSVAYGANDQAEVARFVDAGADFVVLEWHAWHTQFQISEGLEALSKILD